MSYSYQNSHFDEGLWIIILIIIICCWCGGFGLGGFGGFGSFAPLLFCCC